MFTVTFKTAISETLKAWYEERKAALYATGWRPHGLKVGDKVRVVANGLSREDFWDNEDLSDYIDEGVEGIVVDTTPRERVVVEFKAIRHPEENKIQLCVWNYAYLEDSWYVEKVEAPAADFASYEDYKADALARLRSGVAKHGNRVQSVIIDTFESTEEDEEIIVTAAADFDTLQAQITASLTLPELQALRDTVASATLSDYERNLLLWACDNAIRDIRTVEAYAAKQAARKDPAPEQIAWRDTQYKAFLLDI